MELDPAIPLQRPSNTACSPLYRRPSLSHASAPARRHPQALACRGNPSVALPRPSDEFLRSVTSPYTRPRVPQARLCCPTVTSVLLWDAPSGYFALQLHLVVLHSVVMSRKALSGLEQLVMDYVWAHPRSSAAACRDGIAGSRPLKENTVRTLLQRLE